MKKIETKRTLLRRLNFSDIENMQKLESDPLVMRFTPSRVPQSREQTLKRLEGQIAKQDTLEPFGVWGADNKMDSSFIGWFMLVPSGENCLELGFMIVKECWNQGLTTEICDSLIKFAQSHSEIKRITAKTDLDNIASIRTLEKLGFKYIKNILTAEKVNGGEVELKVFDLNFTT